MRIMLVAVLSATITAAAGPAWAGERPSDDRLVALQNACALLHSLQDKIVHAERDRQEAAAEQALRDFDALGVPADSLAADVFACFRARLLARAGNTAEATDAFASLVARPSVAMESLLGLEILLEHRDNEEYEQADYERGEQLRQLMYSVAPTTFRLGCSRGGCLSDCGPAWSPPTIPFVDLPRDHNGEIARIDYPEDPSLDGIARLFAKMRMHALAATAFREAIYAKIWHADGIRPWLSPDAAPLWLSAADAEWGCGNVPAMADCLAKAIIFGSERDAAKGQELIAKAREHPAPPAEAPQPDAAWLKKIAWWYTQMNMHPRALDILHEYSGMLADAAPMLEHSYSREWLALLDSCYEQEWSAPKRRLPVCGQQVPEGAERLKLIIPPPCRPEALAHAAEEVKALLAAK